MTAAAPTAASRGRRPRLVAWSFWILLGLAALILWAWPTGLRTTRQVFTLADGTSYTVEYYARWVGWQPPEPMERELLDPKVYLDLGYDFSIRRRGLIGVCRHNLGELWQDITGWWDAAGDWFGGVKDRLLVRSRGWDHDINFDLLGIDIRRNGAPLELPEADRQMLYAAMAKRLDALKAWNRQTPVLPGVFYDFEELVHCDAGPDGEWLVIAGYLLRCDGRRLWIEAGTLRP